MNKGGHTLTGGLIFNKSDLKRKSKNAVPVHLHWSMAIRWMSQARSTTKCNARAAVSHDSWSPQSGPVHIIYICRVPGAISLLFLREHENDTQVQVAPRLLHEFRWYTCDSIGFLWFKYRAVAFNARSVFAAHWWLVLLNLRAKSTLRYPSTREQNLKWSN